METYIRQLPRHHEGLRDDWTQSAAWDEAVSSSDLRWSTLRSCFSVRVSYQLPAVEVFMAILKHERDESYFCIPLDTFCAVTGVVNVQLHVPSAGCDSRRNATVSDIVRV